MRHRKGWRHTPAFKAAAIPDNLQLNRPNLQGPMPVSLPQNREWSDGSHSDRAKKLIYQYLQHKKRQTKAGILLFIAGIVMYLCLTLLLSLPVVIEWPALFLALIFLSAAKQWVLSYRVGKGWFCNNEYEASELLRFFDKEFSAN